MFAIAEPRAVIWPDAVRCLVVSVVNVTKLPGGAERPVQDFAVLREAVNGDIVDSENYREGAGPLVRMAERFGRPWAIAAAAVERAAGYDAVIAMSDDVGVPLAALMHLFRPRTPTLVIAQHMVSKRPALIIGRLRMTRALAKFLCMCPAQARYLRDHYHVSEEKLEVIHWHTDHRFYRPMPEVAVRRQVCSAGMTFRDYNTLLLATRGLDAQVKIEARSAWFNNGTNIAPEAMHEGVEICNYGTSAGLRQLYAESEIVVVPLLNVPVVGGYSTLLEGMAMGKPVIASRIPMIGEFIEDGWNGFLVAPENPAELRERIDYLLAHPDHARQMGQNARATVERHFTLDHYRQRIRAAVFDAVAGSVAVQMGAQA